MRAAGPSIYRVNSQNLCDKIRLSSRKPCVLSFNKDQSYTLHSVISGFRNLGIWDLGRGSVGKGGPRLLKMMKRLCGIAAGARAFETPAPFLTFVKLLHLYHDVSGLITAVFGGSCGAGLLPQRLQRSWRLWGE